MAWYSWRELLKMIYADIKAWLNELPVYIAAGIIVILLILSGRRK